MPNIGDKVRTELDVYFNRFVEIIKQGINSVLNQLSTKLLPCRSVYVMYKNLGTYLCQDVGGPVHGIWASAGLCGIWFVITAAIIFAIDRTLSADDLTSPPRKSPSSPPSQT
ncbi:hypothetical protein OESDEN_17098 [Oesophagostomum dentatum]|uniref:Uncharacterized protein n=1 Tax=Oesophagostomum dentatum TaxID=61180 RepID=A0A0B1SJ38_OESDE|nr:hypothetical protein OESDEN_17098 [Oesophagostomum dentatum]